MTSDRTEISRRNFTTTTTVAAAAVVAGAARRVLGANDRVVLASIGIRGQGNALKQGFARLAGVEIKTLCDPDENLFAARANDPVLAGARRASGPATRRTSAVCWKTRTSTRS